MWIPNCKPPKFRAPTPSLMNAHFSCRSSLISRFQPTGPFKDVLQSRPPLVICHPSLSQTHSSTLVCHPGYFLHTLFSARRSFAQTHIYVTTTAKLENSILHNPVDHPSKLLRPPHFQKKAVFVCAIALRLIVTAQATAYGILNFPPGVLCLLNSLLSLAYLRKANSISFNIFNQG